MSLWRDRVGGHSVWQLMETLGPSLDRATHRDGIDGASIEGIERLRLILTFAGKRLAGADPDLLQLAPLDGIAGSMQSILSDVTAYETDGDAARIVAANTHADSVVAHLSSVHYPHVSDDLIALRDASVAYRNTLEQNTETIHTSLSAIKNEASNLEQRLTELRGAIDTENTKLTAIGTDFQTKYSEAEATRTKEFAEKVQTSLEKIGADATAVQQRLTELGTEVTAERSRLTTLGSEFQSQFSTAQESRSRDFSETQTTRLTTFSTLMTEYTQRLSEQNAEFTKERDAAFLQHQTNVAELKDKYGQEARTVLDLIQQHKRDVEKLVGVIGNLGVTSGYQKTANQAWWSMLVWQVIAVSAMIGVIVFAFVAFLPLTQGAFSWENFAGRVVLSLAVGVLAAYAASQADKHLEIERRNRKLALELEAMGPYLAPLPVEKQEAFRLQIGDRTFGREESGLGRRAAERSPATLVDVLMKSKELRELIADIVKAARG